MMGAGAKSGLRGAASVAVLLGVALPSGAMAREAYAMASSNQAMPVLEELNATQQRPNINPYDRDIAMTVPLNFNRRVLGEMDVLLTRDDRFIVYSEGFLTLIKPLLTDAAFAEMQQVLVGKESFAPEDIESSGVRLDYDPAQLAVMVLRIDPSKRAIESLYQAGAPEAPADAPESFSAYLNTSLSASKQHNNSDIRKPSVYLNGAVRVGQFVLEADYQGQEQFGSDEYNFDRRYARLVYDQPEDFRRWWLGDMEPEIRGRQSYVQLGGVGVARQRQRFESFRNSILSGNRQIVLQEGSTVRVLRNGVYMREFQLDAGQYDLSNLPLETGSNDIQLEIRDVLGRTQTVQYSAYLDAIDLDPGDYEYAAYLGVTNTGVFGSPDYKDGDLAFTGYWRKAFENRPALGLGLQASENVQNVTGQTQFILNNGARIRLDASASNADVGQGFSGSVALDHFVDRGLVYDSWAVAVDYVSEDYASLGNVLGQNPASWTVQGSYSRRFNLQWMGSVSGNYRVSRTDILKDSYTVNAFSTYNFTPSIGVQFGVEYADFGNINGSSVDGFGFNFALIWTPDYKHRGEARYGSARKNASMRFQRSSENRVGAWGYSVASTYDDGPATLSGQMDYIGNRFDGSIVHTAFGQSFSDITDQQVTGVTVGSSIAYAGGKVAIGRRIFDSFAIVDTHPSLGSRPAIVGDSLQGGAYNARSGALGPALANNLTAYVNQSVRYDVIDVPAGYDIGDGIKRVRPGYRSGYVIQAGSDAFVSAVGRLVGHADKPIALVSGRMTALDEPDFKPEVFFTNSVGRFAIQKLKPGQRYRVELFTSPISSFEFQVPEDSEGLLDLSKVSVPIIMPEQ